MPRDLRVSDWWSNMQCILRTQFKDTINPRSALSLSLNLH